MSKKGKKIPRWTTEQKQWFHRRDENMCQFIDLSGLKPVVCHSTERLEVHHISPFNWSKKVLHWKEEQINSAENGILLCWNCHQTLIHGDYGLTARKLYKHDANSYKLIAERHNLMAKAKIPYWYQGFDELLKMIARARTREYLRRHPDDPFPSKNAKIREQS